jgi:hypothetical protein
MCRLCRGILVLTWLGLVLAPTSVHAQASITGVVKDTSGAVLPGVTVEAASPALIEKVRTGVTDGTGQYRIEDLRPGIYSVTFTLNGFSIVKREDIELTGSFTATVNTELKVGTVEQTITVTGETPLVDVQSARREQVLNNDVLTAIPSVRNYNALLPLVPGITTGTNDVFVGPIITLFSFHGGPSSEGRVLLDGIIQGNVYGGNSVSNYVADIGNSEEVSFTTSGGLGEAETAGALMNIVPRTGANAFNGSFFASGSNSAMQGSNYTQALKDAGLNAPNPLTKAYDVDGAFGGPIRKDRLWYFGNVRAQGTTRYVTNLYYNKNAGDPTKWTYDPDVSRQAYSDRTWDTAGLRLTWQVTPRNKVSLYWDEQPICLRCTGSTAINQSPDPLTSPEAQGISILSPQRVQQVSWKSPVTSRFLLEGGLGTYFLRWDKERPDNVTRGLVRVTEQCTAGCSANGNIPGLTYRSDQWTNNWGQAYNPRASLSYITGAHSMKFGYQGFFGLDQNSSTNTASLSYRVNNAVPNQLTMFGDPIVRLPRVTQTSLYAQEQWTRGRLTLQGAVRYDHASSHFLDQQAGPTRFIPVPLMFPAQDGVEGYQDITPRAGVAYDVFGNGRTAVKLNVGKYLAPASVSGIYINTNPLLLISSQVTRSWIDANGNWVPDCNLLNPAAQDLRASGGDLCGAMSNQNFGRNVLSTTYDPALLKGWGVRPSDWNFGVSVQHQVVPRVSAEVGYYRRWDHNFIVTDNRAVGPADFNSFCITEPSDARLPSGGGSPICGLYDVNPAKFGQVDNFVTLASNYGNQTQYWHGVDVTVNARALKDVTVQAGFSNGQTVTDNCEVRTALPEIATLNPYCHVASGFLPQVRGLASYTIPKVDVQIGATFQTKLVFPVGLAANYTVANAAVAPSLGRNLAGNVPNVTVNLVAPGTLEGNRVNQIDLRVAKIVRFGRTRTTIGLDLYNVLNSDAVLAYNQAFILGGAWLTPTSVLTARLARLNVDIRF